MTKNKISAVANPSEEIVNSAGELTTDKLLHDVELYNLYHNPDSPENNPERIFNITYPTSVLRRVVETTLEKLNGRISNGSQIISGDYGSGKSHIGLVLNHLFEHPQYAESWLDDAGITVGLPKDVEYRAFQMFNLETNYNYLWEPIFEHFGKGSILDQIGDIPSVRQIRELIGESNTVVFLDEVEPWLRMGIRAEYREENLAFLQNLMEAAADSSTPLAAFVTLLYNEDDVQQKVQRTGPHIYDLTVEDDEKLDFIVHRLIESVDDSAVEEIAQEYVDVYRQNAQIEFDNYQRKQEEIVRYYPFHPDMLKLLVSRFAEGGGHQDARGLLDFLTRVLADNFNEVDLVLTSDVDVNAHANRLRAIDPELVSKYRTDYDRLHGDGGFEEFVEELLNVVLLHSLTRGGAVGANKRQRIIGIIRKGMGANRIEQAFQNNVYGHAWHIHRLNGEYAFDVERNPSAQIEKRASDVSKPEAIKRIERLIVETYFDDRENVYIWHGVENEIEIPDNKGIKLLVRLDASESYLDDFLELTQGEGREFQNTFAIVTPEQRSSIDTNTGIIQVARRVVAGERLISYEEESLPKEFSEIHEKNVSTLEGRVLEKFGQVYTATTHEDSTRLAPERISPNGLDLYSPAISVIEPDDRRMRRVTLEELDATGSGGIRYEYLKNDFFRQIRLPTLTSEKELKQTLTQLCDDGEIQIGDEYETRPRTIADTDTVLHAKYIEEPEEDPTEPTAPTVDTSDISDGSSETVAAKSTSQSSTQTTDTSTTTSTPETDTPDPEPTLVSVPPMGPLEAENKFELIDTLERELESEWVIHEFVLGYTGPLSADELESDGLASNTAVADNASIDQTLTFSPTNTLSKREVIGVVNDLTPPENVSFTARFKIESANEK